LDRLTANLGKHVDWISTWPTALIQVVFGITLVIAALAISVWVLLKVLWTLGSALPNPYRKMALKFLSLGEYEEDERSPNVEIQSALPNHWSISEWVAQRIGLSTFTDFPNDILQKFNLIVGRSYRPDDEKPKGRSINQVEYRLLMLSVSILGDRDVYWNRRRSKYIAPTNIDLAYNMHRTSHHHPCQP
jgi:hypothetical protein